MMMVMAVILHNIPEGMGRGVVFAGAVTGQSDMTAAAAFVLALGNRPFSIFRREPLSPCP